MRQRLADLLRGDARRLALLRQVRALALPDAWIGAGFVRNAVWDMLAGRPPRLPADIDVIWFDRARAQPLRDTALERRLARTGPPAPWSVKNQSRMHARNQDAPYACCGDALRSWPETATAVAVRLDALDRIEILAPLGLDDLFAGIVRPTPRFRGAKHGLFEARLRDKQWLAQWPFLRLMP